SAGVSGGSMMMGPGLLPAGTTSYAACEFSFLSEGPHRIQFSAVRGGVPEASDTYAVVVDTTPPATRLSFGPGRSGSYLPLDTLITLPSSDTALPDRQAGSGVSQILYSIDGSTFAYTQPFALSVNQGLFSGSHAFQWYAIDHLGNTEPVQSMILVLDN